MGEIKLHLDASLAQRLERVSAQTGQSAEDVALDAIIERIEEAEDAPAARRRLEDLENGTESPVPHDEVVRRLGLED